MGAERGGLDDAALEALYVRLEKSLYNVVYRWLWQPSESRDVVQEAFFRLWRMRRRVRVESVEPLVYRIALNLAAKRRRSLRVWKRLSLDAVALRGAREVGAENGIIDRERASAVRDAVEGLPADLREVVVLCELSDLTYDQIGEVLSIPAGTVGSRRHRALELLRTRLGEWSGRSTTAPGATSPATETSR